MDGKFTSSPRQRNSRERTEPEYRAVLTPFLRYPMLTLLVIFGMVFFLISAFRKEDTDQTGRPANQSEIQVQHSTEQAATTAAPTSSKPSETVVSTEETVPITTTVEPVTTEPPGPVMMTVDDSYFYDALFLGDSRTDGLFLYDTPGDCKHYPYPATSMTIFRIMDAEDENNRYGFKTTRDLLKGMSFGKIYLMFGINECGYDTNYFAQTYADVVNEIREYQPDAIIYIQSICYVTQKHENNYPVFATANIKEKNEAIKKLANDVDIFYLEINDCLNDGTDHLPSAYTGDGAHLKPQYYELWHNYLLEHAVVDAKHPWSADAPEPEGAEVEHP